jgi:hypothetical protein
LSVESLGVTATQLRTRPVGFVLSALNGLLMSTYLLSIYRLFSHSCDQQCSRLRRVLIDSRVALVVLVVVLS